MVWSLHSKDPVLLGLEKEIQPPKSNVIRIFISSTFTDMTIERNELMKRTFPRLQEYFQNHALEFQIVDMRWGIREESVLDHQATNFCLQEIENSQKLSVGVCFLALLGDKYGNCPLPAVLSVAHYDLFIDKLSKAKRVEDINLLKEWYKLDTNAVPAHYILMPLSEKYLQTETGEGKIEELKAQQREEWSKASAKIRIALHEGVNSAFKSKEISAEEKHNYIMAVTEREITEGILLDPLANERTLCFVRTFERLNEKSSIAGRFMDLDSEGKRLDHENFSLQQLRDKKISAKLQKDNIRRYSIEWDMEKGLNPEKNARHKAYLDRLCEDVYEQILTVSEKRIAQLIPPKHIRDWIDDWHDDIEQHVRTVQLKAPNFVQRRKLTCYIQRLLRFEGFWVNKSELGDLNLTDIGYTEAKSGSKHRFWKVGKQEIERKPKNFFRNREYFEQLEAENETPKAEKHDTSDTVLVRKPVIVHGPSGFGKSSVLAKLFERFCSSSAEDRKCLDWGVTDEFGILKIARFMGTTAKSCSIRDVIESLIVQIWTVFQIPLGHGNDMLKDLHFSVLCEFFANLIWSLREYKGKVLIVLDAVDQLRSDDNPYNMQWLPRFLPPNVHLFVSIIPDMFDLLENCEKILPPHPMCYCKIEGMGMDSACTFLQAYGVLAQRTLTPQQTNVILDNFAQCRVPMFLKLAFERAKDWKSFTRLEHIKLGKNVKELIVNLFDSLSIQYGKATIKALQYISRAREGLTDAEMDDLLSLDDFVMTDVFVHHLPPDPKIIRFPTMIWRRIRKQLDEYISVRKADQKLVLNWYHRQFHEVSFKTVETGVHQKLASYFSGEWHGKPKPLTLYKGKVAEYPDAQRNAPAMPWTYDDKTANLRKLTEYAYHLIMAYNADEAADVLCSFDYLLNKLRFQGYKSLLADFKLYFDQFAPGHDVRTGDLVYVKIFQGIKETQNQSEELNESSLCVKIVYDLLVMAGDILVNDWTELPGNLIGRLGPMWTSHERIGKLVESSKNWCQTCKEPLLVPRYHCMVSPGTFLRTTISHLISFPGIARNNRNPILLGENKLLYAREVGGDTGDKLQIYDLSCNGELIKTISLNLTFDRFQFLNQQKFMLIQPTPLDGETNEKVEGPIIINLESFLQVSFESNFEQIFASSTGHFLICIRGPEVTTCKLEKSGIQPAGKSFSLPVLKTVANVIVTTCDSKIVCLTDKGELWYQNMITGNLIQLSVDEGESTEIIGDLANVKLIVSPEYLLVHRGLRKRTEANLYGINLMAPEEPLKCFKESPFPLHLTIMHKTGRWIAAATEIDYVFTVTTVNSNHCRLYVFDVESTTPVFRVKGTKGAFSCIQFLGDQHQYLGFSRKYDPMLVIVGLGTPDEPNHTATQLLRVSGGHAKAIYGVLYDNTESLLVTCSSDNTIKTWDLVAVLNVCELACKNTDMQKPVDKRSKLGQEEFLSQKQETLLKAGLDLAKLEHLQFASNLADELDRKDLAGCHAKVIAVAKSGSYAVCGCVFGRLSFFNLKTGRVVVAQGHSFRVKKVHSVVFSSDDTQVFTAAAQAEVLVWETATGYFLRIINLSAPVNCLAVVDSHLYMGLGEQIMGGASCVVWKIGEYAEPTAKYPLEHGFLTLAVTSDQNWIFTLVNFALSFINCRTLQTTINESKFKDSFVTENFKDARPVLKITKDDQFAVACVFQYVEIMHVGSNELMELDCSALVADLELLNSNKHALIAMYKNVELIELQTCQRIKTFEAHGEYVSAISLASHVLTATLFVTVSQDKAVKLWSLSLENLKMELLGKITFYCPLRVVKFAFDGSFILVGPESAAPLAILKANPILDRQIAKITGRNSSDTTVEKSTAIKECLIGSKSNCDWNQITAEALEKSNVSIGNVELIISICSMFSTLNSVETTQPTSV